MKPFRSCRATSRSMRSTYAGSQTPAVLPAPLCVAQPMATCRALKWWTTTLPAMWFAPRRAQMRSTDRSIASCRRSRWTFPLTKTSKLTSSITLPLNVYSIYIQVDLKLILGWAWRASYSFQIQYLRIYMYIFNISSWESIFLCCLHSWIVISFYSCMMKYLRVLIVNRIFYFDLAKPFESITTATSL